MPIRLFVAIVFIHSLMNIVWNFILDSIKQERNKQNIGEIYSWKNNYKLMIMNADKLASITIGNLHSFWSVIENFISFCGQMVFGWKKWNEKKTIDWKMGENNLINWLKLLVGKKKWIGETGQPGSPADSSTSINVKWICFNSIIDWSKWNFLCHLTSVFFN